MRSLVLGVVLASSLPAVLRAQIVDETSQAQVPPTQLMDLNLMEALIAVKAEGLAGVFAFVPERSAPAAFADYILHDRKAFKRFLKKAARDLKELNGISAWDRMVYMVILQMNGSFMPPGVQNLNEKEEKQISEFVLARPLTLQEITAARGARR